MKRNKISTLLLASNLFISSTITNISLASSEIDNRYEIFEGEYISIDNSTEGNLEDIEIFGNTIQDSNNLEDIQSVGDLYVNKKGEPILDSQGRKQYKINLYTSKNLFKEDEMISKNNQKRILNFDGSKIILKNIENYNYITETLGTITLDKGIYTWYATNIEGTISVPYTLIELLNENYQGIRIAPSGTKTNTFEVLKNNTTFDVRITTGGLNNQGNIWSFNIQLEKNNKTTSYEFYKNNKTEIILPCQLQKVGNIKDRLYWDSDKKRYVIEKNIEYWHITATEQSWRQHVDYTPGAGYSGFNFIISQVFNSENMPNFYSPKIGNNGFATNAGHGSTKRGTDFHANGNGKLLIEESLVANDSLSDLQLWLSENYSYILYQLANSKIIETNITKKININTYENHTYIFTEQNNGINPTLKITVDRIEQVSGEAVENVISNPTSANVALARMLINMLPESLYKDQLQAKLNEIFSEDMVLEKQSATANLDVYIKSENILMMSLDTNTVTFEDYSGVEELELQHAINISINSSLPYQLNAYIVGDIINKNKDKTLNLDVLNIRDSSEIEYKKFDSINNKIILKDSCAKGNSVNHNIDLKLSGYKAHDADIYKTTIRFEAEQK